MASESYLEALAELQGEARDAKGRAAELKSQRARPDRMIRAAEAQLASAHREAEAEGRELTKTEATKLGRGLSKARTEAEIERQRIAGQTAGATEAAAAAEAAVVGFAQVNRAELVAELTAHALEDRDELLDAIEALRQTRWGATAAAATALMRVWGEGPGSIPPNPLDGASAELDSALAPLASGLRRDPRRLVPVPSDWLPEE